LRKDFTLDVVFVVDTTASMGSFIEGLKQVVAEVVATIDSDSDLADRVRFGFVAYRDVIAGPGLEYHTSLICDLPTGADHKEFQRRIKTVHEAPVSSEEFEEDVLAGLQMAIKDSGWNPKGHKAVVLIGDASAHLEIEGPKNPKRLTIPGIAAAAQPAGGEAAFEKIVIHGLRVLSHAPSDHARCKDHFGLLTAGRGFPGLHWEYNGADGAGKFTAELVTALKAMARVTKDVSDGKYRELEQRAKEAKPGSPEQRMLGPVLEMIRASESNSPGISFASGYACSIDVKGNQALEPHIMITRGRLSVFQSGLNYCVTILDTAGDPTKKDVGKIVKGLQLMTTSISTGETIDPDTPYSKILGLLAGFPVQSPIFDLTPRKVAAMPEADFQAWVSQVRGVEAIIKAHLDNSRLWFQLGNKAVRDQDRIAFVKDADLP
jgi:hypothetical protein